jgi:hypothetical protein
LPDDFGDEALAGIKFGEEFTNRYPYFKNSVTGTAKSLIIMGDPESQAMRLWLCPFIVWRYQFRYRIM